MSDIWIAEVTYSTKHYNNRTRKYDILVKQPIEKIAAFKGVPVDKSIARIKSTTTDKILVHNVHYCKILGQSCN